MNVRNRRNRNLKAFQVDMTPMVDIVFLLIIFFMISSSFVKDKGVNVDLPEAASSKSSTQNDIVISVLNNGQIYFNKIKVTPRRLRKILIKQSQNQSKNKDIVIIKGDKSAPYEKIMQVMDIARLSGFNNLSLSTD